MKCPRCKKQLRKGAKFCPACGARVEKKRGIRFTSILLVIVFLLSIVAIGWSGGILFAKYFGGNFKDLFSRKKNVEIHNVEEAIAHARNLGKEYGYENALSELTEKVTTTIDGDSYYRLQQNYQGIPVYGKTVVYVTDENNQLMSITGDVVDVDGHIDMTPSVSKNATLKSIQIFVNQYSDLYIESITDVSLDSGNICMYFNTENDRWHLAYTTVIDFYEFVVDAHDGEVLYAESAFRTSSHSGTLQGQERSYQNIEYIEENGKFQLINEDRQISSWQASNKLTWDSGNLIRLWDSTNLIEWESGERPAPDAVDAYVNSIVSYDFFDQVLGIEGPDGLGKLPINIVTGIEWYTSGDDAKDIRKNAMAAIIYDDEKNPEYAGIYIGEGLTPTFAAYLDVVAHEYTHNVEKMHSGMRYSGESGAIMEALSDIFGELIESWNAKNEPNWMHGTSRNIAHPEETNNPSSYGDGNWIDKILDKFDNDGVHRNSTVVSHAAYLMWNGINGNDSKKIDTNTLAKLWYRAMLMMPVDCDFSTCRQMVEWAALAVDGITDEQRACIAEAFDMVGIEDVTLSPEILVDCDRNVRPDSVLNVYSVEGDLHPRYTLNITGTVAEKELAYASNILSDIGYRYETTEEITKAKSYHLDLLDGYYTFKITDSNNPMYSYTFTVSVSDQGTDNIIELHTDFEDKLVVKVTDPPKSNAYEAYISAVNKTIATGSWSEHLVMTANMAITDGSAKTKTKVTLTSDANVSNYSESDPSQIRMSGSAEMTVMGQTYAWDMDYENGTAHYRYTKPNQNTADMKIDPSFFNFGTMTSDMMTNAKLSGNKITFTVPGDKIAEVGIAAVNQMSGVDNLEYGDVDVTVIISNEGKIDNIVMAFHASLEYQGYDADVDYNIDYRFSDSYEKSDKTVFGDMGSLQEYLDLSKSWGIKRTVSENSDFNTDQVLDFAFMEDGTFYAYFYQQYTDFLHGYCGTYLFKDKQIEFYFENANGTSTAYAYSFDTDTMKLTQVSEKGIWNGTPGTEYNLKNDEWFPSAQNVIDSAKRAIENRGVEMGG